MIRWLPGRQLPRYNLNHAAWPTALGPLSGEARLINQSEHPVATARARQTARIFDGPRLPM